MDFSYILGILTLAGINLIAVLGLSLLTGFTGLFSFGHAGFMLIGAYVGVWFNQPAGGSPAGLGLPFLVGLVAGAVASGLMAWIIGKITLRLKGDYFCIATLGFGEAIRLVFDNFQGFGGSRGWPLTITPGPSMIWIILACDLVGVLFLANLIRSRHGRNMIAVREEELAAQIAGVNVVRYKMLSLIVSAVYAGVAGYLLANYLTFLQPKIFNLQKSTELTIIVIFGGLGSISGSVIGALVLTILPEMLRFFSIWRFVFYGAAVILIMVARPQGLMGGMELSPAGLRKARAARLARRAILAESEAGSNQGGRR